MSALNPPRKITKRQELRQDQVVTMYARAWGFADQNRKLIAGIVAALAVLVLVVVAYVFWQNSRADEAQVLLGGALPAYEQGDYRAALDGTQDAPGLLAIADEYGSTDAGNLARFYAADALYRLGEYEESLRFFRAFDADDDVLGAAALAGQAAVLENTGQFAEAGDLYRRAAGVEPNEFTSPQYLLYAGRAYEAAGAFDKARAAYEAIADDYPESNLASGVAFYVARVNARAQGAN